MSKTDIAMNPRRTTPGGHGRRGNGNEDELRQGVIAELAPGGPTERFLVDCVIDALQAFDTAASPGTLMVDPLTRTQEQVVEELYGALGQLRGLQAHRQSRARKAVDHSVGVAQAGLPPSR